MRIFLGNDPIDPPLRNPVVAIGNFDGVHIGHRQLLALACREARDHKGEAVVLTFDPHPGKVLAPAKAPPLLTSTDRKLELLAESGVAACVLQRFTRALAGQSADEFVDDILVRRLGVRAVVVGYNFTYARKREGDVETLRAAGESRGFAVHVVPPVVVDGFSVSSTRIRDLLAAGDVEETSVLLGRDYDATGRVVAGAGRGRSIGVPTANIETDAEILPRPGVYAALVSVLDLGADAECRPAVVNLGTNPTFTQAGRLSLEAHVLDFDGDLYGCRVRVFVHARLRDETRFPSAEALVAQIRRDIERAREIFPGAKP